MNITRVLAGVGVDDVETAAGWYERLLGRFADQRPMAGLAEWQAAGAGGIQVFHDPDHVGSSSLTLGVADLDQTIAELGERGRTASAVSKGETSRFASIADPAGNRITIAEPLAAEKFPVAV